MGVDKTCTKIKTMIMFNNMEIEYEFQERIVSTVCVIQLAPEHVSFEISSFHFIIIMEPGIEYCSVDVFCTLSDLPVPLFSLSMSDTISLLVQYWLSSRTCNTNIKFN